MKIYCFILDKILEVTAVSQGALISAASGFSGKGRGLACAASVWRGAPLRRRFGGQRERRAAWREGLFLWNTAAHRPLRSMDGVCDSGNTVCGRSGIFTGSRHLG